MNRKQIPLFATLLLISVVVLESRAGFCAGEIPKGWGTYGNQVQNYAMGIDLAVKHTGKAGAYIKFVGDSAVGFGTLMQAWVDDFQFEVAGTEAATTNMLSPEQMNKEHNLDAPANLPKQPANLDFEEGAWPERKVANVNSKIFEAYVGQYQGPSGQAWMVSVETNRLWLDDTHSGNFELLPQSETEFFVKDWPMATFIFVKNEKSVVTHYLSRFNGEDTVIKKIK